MINLACVSNPMMNAIMITKSKALDYDSHLNVINLVKFPKVCSIRHNIIPVVSSRTITARAFSLRCPSSGAYQQKALLPTTLPQDTTSSHIRLNVTSKMNEPVW